MQPTLLDERDTGLRWSARVIDLDTGLPILDVSSDRILKTASVGKLFLLVDVARQAEAGTLALDEPLDRRTETAVADSGLWHTLDVNILTIADACRLVGAVSDNLATNVLIGRVGIDAVAATTRDLGYVDSGLLDRVREDRGPEHPPTLSRGTGAELARLMADLHAGSVVSPEVSGRVLDWIGLNTDLSMVAAAFGLDPLAHLDEDRGVLLRNKTGTISTARVDVGVVTLPSRRLAWAVLANWDADAPPDVRDRVLAVMRSVGAWMAR